MNGIQSCDWRSQAIVHSPQFEHIQEERLREQNQRILNNLQFRGAVALMGIWRRSCWRSRTQIWRFVGLESSMVLGVRRSLVLAHRRSQQSCRCSSRLSSGSQHFKFRPIPSLDWSSTRTRKLKLEVGDDTEWREEAARGVGGY